MRAKRGTAQGSRDAQGGNAPKSAGATLRRYNEAALTQVGENLTKKQVRKTYMYLVASKFSILWPSNKIVTQSGTVVTQTLSMQITRL